MKKQLNPTTLFHTNEAGMVELVLTPDELATIIDTILFAKNVMDASAKKMETMPDLTQEEKSHIAELQLKSYTTSIVYERLLADTTGDGVELASSLDSLN